MPPSATTATNPNMKDWLKKNAARFKSESKRAKDAANKPDGKYVFKLSSVKDEPNRDNTAPQMHYVWVILAPAPKGRQHHVWADLGREDGWYYECMTLSRLGYDPDEIDTDGVNWLGKLCKQITKDSPACVGELKTGKSGYQNFKVLKALEPEELEEAIEELMASGEAAEDTDEDEDVETEEDAAEDEETEEDEDEEAAEEEEEEDSEEQTRTLEKGDRIAFGANGERRGVFLGVDEETGKYRIKADDTGKVAKADPDSCFFAEEDEEE